MAPTWQDEDKVHEYVGRVGRLAARAAGEAELVEAVPAQVDRTLDLGCGDGRLLGVVLDARPTVREAVGLDNSPPMLERARDRFGGDPRVAVEEHDLRDALPVRTERSTSSCPASPSTTSPTSESGPCSRRSRRCCGPAGVFANLEVVRCATPELQEEFHRRIGKPGGDPEDILAGVEEQLGWMRDAGLVQVDCAWRWRGFALLVGEATAAG